MAEKTVLFKLTNLKQHFPLKTKGLYVKANDGITLDIYDGETLGLVGESGCGKSTLGRTLLRLYDPTDGKIMYYGRLLTDLPPAIWRTQSKSCPSTRSGCALLRKPMSRSRLSGQAVHGGAVQARRGTDRDEAQGA